MRVRLLNDGGFGDMDRVQFPVVVEACGFEPGGLDLYFVKGSELIAVGASIDCEDPYLSDREYPFASKGEDVECEVLSE